jgi:transposase-like protein
MAKNAKSAEQPERAGKRAPHSADFKRHALRPLLRYLAAWKSGGRVAGLSQAAKRRARQVGVSSRTVFRWLRRLRDFGEGGLEFARRDKGVSSRFEDRNLAVAFVCAKLVEGMSAKAIHAELKSKWRELYGDGDKSPCYDTVRKFVRAIALAPQRVQP